MILSVAFWMFIAYFGIAVSIVVCFLVWDLTRVVTTDPNPSICKNCSCQDFDYVKEDDNSHRVPYGCEYDVKVCKNCGDRTIL
jgi:hypothetical protein